MSLPKKRSSLSSIDDGLLFQCCQQGNVDLLAKHLDRLSSADIASIRDESQATLAHCAARYGHLNILRYLVESKHLALGQLRTNYGATCAHDAAVCDQVEAMEYMLHCRSWNQFNDEDASEKLRWTVRDDEGNSPLHLAAAYDSVNTLHYLLKRELADPRIRSFNGFQPIHYAAIKGHLKSVELLLSFAADTINEHSNTLLTPVYLACRSGSLETVQFLFSHGANLKLRDENGLTCLHAACHSSHLDIVRWLVEAQKSNIDDVDYMNRSPLHYAAGTGDESILTYLLSRNAQLVTSATGNTPLHVAAEHGQQRACEILVEQGQCLLAQPNKSRLTPADLAHLCGFSSLADTLRARATPATAVEKNSAPTKSIQLQNASVVRLVVKKRHTQRIDAANQVDEKDLTVNVGSRVGRQHQERDPVRKMQMDPIDNILLHSMESLNQQNKSRQRPKLPVQTYGPWLKMGNMTPEMFQEEIQKVGSNLRKGQRESLLEADQARTNPSERRERQSQSVGPAPARYVDVSSRTSDVTNGSDRVRMMDRRTDVPKTSQVVSVPKSHQFIVPSVPVDGQSDVPEWQRILIDRRRATIND